LVVAIFFGGFVAGFIVIRALLKRQRMKKQLVVV